MRFVSVESCSACKYKDGGWLVCKHPVFQTGVREGSEIEGCGGKKIIVDPGKCIQNYCPLPRSTIPYLIEQAHAIAKGKGFWDLKRNKGELLMLMVSELSEALEVLREGGTQEAFSEELADCCIRIFDMCGHEKIDLEKALHEKMEKNRERPHKHGKEF